MVIKKETSHYGGPKKKKSPQNLSNTYQQFFVDVPGRHSRFRQIRREETNLGQKLDELRLGLVLNQVEDGEHMSAKVVHKFSAPNLRLKRKQTKFNE